MRIKGSILKTEPVLRTFKILVYFFTTNRVAPLELILEKVWKTVPVCSYELISFRKGT